MDSTQAMPKIGRIRVLPTLVANQIAAGEVVERPASVVKELVENALDAGAGRVTIELEQGGIELVRVTDDGGGIPQQDLPLSIAPHATSKIADAADLDRIGTLGFRGEALASIASVSRMLIRSRTRDDIGASEIEVEGDRVGAVRPASGPVGTSVGVRNLFFNTPARRKFLRTIPTEQERCVDVVKQLALAHPAAAFTCICDGRKSLDVPPDQTPRERALSVLGKELAPMLLDVGADAFDDSRGLTLWGLAGLPSIARGTSKHQYVFVNGRAVRDRTIQHAIAEAYRGLIEPSRYPTVVLMIEMSPSGVDVNVHPQKAEVRFRDSSMVHSAVLRSLREALRGADLTPALGMLRPVTSAPGPWSGNPNAHARDLPGSGAEITPTSEIKERIAQSVSRFVESIRKPSDVMDVQPAANLGTELQPLPPAGGTVLNSEASVRYEPRVIGTPPPVAPVLAAPEPAARVLQVHKSYLVTQDEQGVVIIDQHALHERVMFEYLLARVAAGGLESQRLLAPVRVPSTRSQIEALPGISQLLARLGIEAEPISPTEIGIHAFATFLFDRGVDPVDFMQALLEKAESGPLAIELKSGGETAMRDVLDMMACKAAVKAGDRLTDTELAELVRMRVDVERSSNCPHGRPTSIRLTIRELEKLFGRT